MNFVLPVRNYKDSRMSPERNFLPEFIRLKSGDNEHHIASQVDQSIANEQHNELASSQPAAPTTEAN